MTRLQKIGLTFVILSLLVGIGGTGWSIYSSFAALEVAENIGSGAVGDRIRNALASTIVGLVGTMIGVALLIFGRRRNKPTRSQRPDELSTAE